MGYEIEEIKKSNEIINYLIRNHELKSTDDSGLYKSFVESERIQNLVKTYGDESACSFVWLGNTIYLMPDANSVFGYTKTELKKELCKSNATDIDFYLSEFVIMVLLLEFYDGQGSSSKIRESIRFGALLNSISEHLKTDAEDEDMIVFTPIREKYESLKSDENNSRSLSTKEGFVGHILQFLEKQGLIEYIVRDEMIKTTIKLDRMMDYRLLNNENYQHVMEIIGEQR